VDVTEVVRNRFCPDRVANEILYCLSAIADKVKLNTATGEYSCLNVRTCELRFLVSRPALGLVLSRHSVSSFIRVLRLHDSNITALSPPVLSGVSGPIHSKYPAKREVLLPNHLCKVCAGICGGS
jgi:hypothetical protein